ncbi:peptidylprolyl isomerase [Anaerocolumna xylanovorans]|uniref:PPIC-type PPIASE domain-containing protein n=1 Tax=Anaerocolumna xylanovorans DSM 12503 TaxID=1121345 RepID=A0A1M7YE01_9FIRM|nr:peptidylprolyl isomerase [Anaerocolumna xylanovorans]SHO50874.1 PPIC-type PPIASE domain-containing protein [Anaerocolumna xylanovorans DSM 12503]
MKKSKRIISRLLIVTLIAGMMLAAGCSKKTSSTGDLVVTINDEKLYMQDMMYFIYAMEAQGQMYAQYYPGYWDMDIEGVTMREQMKQSAMDAAVMWEILYLKAKDAKYSLTDDEKATIKTNVESVMTSLKDKKEQLDLTGFTTENLTKAQEKLQIANKYYEFVVDGLNIKEDDVKSTVDRDKYRQYNTEYLFAATTKYEDSKTVELSDKEKAAAKASIDKALTEVKAGKEFADIVKEDDSLTTSTLNFVKDDGKADEAYQTAALKLKNDAVADSVIETTAGYYIIKMKDNNNSESYDAAVKEAVTKAENDAFTKKYEDEIKKDYKITVNDKVWSKIVMGETTVPKAERITSTPTPAATDTPTPTESTTK